MRLTSANRMTPRSTARATKEIEYLPISILKPYDKNARTHSARQIRQIARSIEHFGFVNPILVDGNRRIICGHGRVAGARLLGLSEVPAITIEHLTEADLRAYVIADNRLAEKAGWDKDILAIEMQGLIDLELDVELTGFETAEIDILFEECSAGSETDSEDPIPQPRPSEVICSTRDLWILGLHRLFCGDARDAEPIVSCWLVKRQILFSLTRPTTSLSKGMSRVLAAYVTVNSAWPVAR